MKEDIENKSLTLIINTSKLTARTLATAFMKFLRYSKNKVREHQNVKPQGKQSVRQLIAQNQGVENTELADRNEAKSLAERSLAFREAPFPCTDLKGVSH